VQDVAGCGMREACLRLEKHAWDIEATLRGFYASGPTVAVPEGRGRTSGRSPPQVPSLRAESWSSCGARLRKDEIDCPICMEPYGALPPVQFQCCLQVMCGACRARVANEHGLLACPFCRTVGRLSDSERLEAPSRQRRLPATTTSRQRSSSLSRVCRRIAGRTFERIAAIPRV
jgi:hypothetical protein